MQVRRALTSNHDTVILKKQIQHTATAADFPQGGNKENRFFKSLTRGKKTCTSSPEQKFSCPSKQLKTYIELSIPPKTDDNFVVQSNTLRHHCCRSKLPPYCFPLSKPRNVPAQVIREHNLGYTLKTLKYGKW